jgi:sialic acid synthase SpsE
MPELIAEACLNHNGDLSKALELISVAKACNCPTIKFQYYFAEILCANRNNFDAYKLLDRVKLRPQWIPILAEECKRQRIELLVTPFCKYSAEDVAEHVKRFKVASPEVKDLSFLKELESYGKPLILSTGKVTYEDLDRIFDEIKVPISLLYCKSLYPSLPSDYDLHEIDRLKKRYRCKVGVSCHCTGIKNAVDAARHNADIIEKHFMLQGVKCPDEAVSLEPATLLKLSQILKEVKNGGCNSSVYHV